MLEAVQIRDPERVLNAYPHEVSGGMGQRIMIAMMLIPGPDLLIADEPTSALDVTVQLQVLGIMDALVRERGMGLIFISHDLRLVATFCDRVLVMYAGRIVEELQAVAPDGRPPSLYARAAELPAEDRRRQGAAAGARPRRGVERVSGGEARGRRASSVVFGHGAQRVDAVRGVSFAVAADESFGIVGESGSGKSTVLRAICGLAPFTAGRIRIDGEPVRVPRGRDFARRVQMVFQDPYASLHPRHTVDRVLAEPLAIHGFADRQDAHRAGAARMSASARLSASACRISSPAASGSASPSPGR